MAQLLLVFMFSDTEPTPLFCLFHHPASSFAPSQTGPLTQLRLIFYRSVVTQHSFREHSNNKKKDKRNKQPPSPQNVSNFPLGCPTPDNIDALCQNKKLRPLYSVKCLAGPQHKLLAQQAKSINRMERGFKVCCKNKQEVLNCAQQKVKWEACTSFAQCSHFVASCFSLFSHFLHFSGTRSWTCFVRN